MWAKGGGDECNQHFIDVPGKICLVLLGKEESAGAEVENEVRGDSGPVCCVWDAESLRFLKVIKLWEMGSRGLRFWGVERVSGRVWKLKDESGNWSADMIISHLNQPKIFT